MFLEDVNFFIYWCHNDGRPGCPRPPRSMRAWSAPPGQRPGTHARRSTRGSNLRLLTSSATANRPPSSCIAISAVCWRNSTCYCSWTRLRCSDAHPQSKAPLSGICNVVHCSHSKTTNMHLVETPKSKSLPGSWREIPANFRSPILRRYSVCLRVPDATRSDKWPRYFLADDIIPLVLRELLFPAIRPEAAQNKNCISPLWQFQRSERSAVRFQSGRWDLNPGPLAPHASALAGLRHAPLVFRL